MSTTTDLLARAREALTLPSLARITEVPVDPSDPVAMATNSARYELDCPEDFLGVSVRDFIRRHATGAHESNDSVFLDGAPCGPVKFCQCGAEARAIIVALLNRYIAERKEERNHEYQS